MIVTDNIERYVKFCILYSGAPNTPNKNIAGLRASRRSGPTSHKATKGRLIENSPSITRRMFWMKSKAIFSGLV